MTTIKCHLHVSLSLSLFLRDIFLRPETRLNLNFEFHLATRCPPWQPGAPLGNQVPLAAPCTINLVHQSSPEDSSRFHKKLMLTGKQQDPFFSTATNLLGLSDLFVGLSCSINLLGSPATPLHV